jgi:hypothetical protein
VNIRETAVVGSGRGSGGAKSEFEAAHIINREIVMNEASKSNPWVSSSNTGEDLWISGGTVAEY